MKRICQIDGGGLMGIIPITFLAELEARLGKPLCEVFDLFSGTSTGAIIAGCLAAGAPASEMQKLYVDKGAMLFKRNWTFPIYSNSKYDRGPLMTEIKNVIWRHGADFMASAKTKFQCVAVDLCQDRNVYFKSWDPEWAQLRMSEAIQRSFSAAAYFGSTPAPAEKAVYADGGEGDANCSLRECIIEAYKLEWHSEGVYILSCGCGHSKGFDSYEHAAGYGTWGQTKEFINLARRQAVATQLYEAGVIEVENSSIKVDRLDLEVQKEHDVLDGLKFTQQYVQYGKKLIADNLNTVAANFGT
jgi:hypothetical protein